MQSIHIRGTSAKHRFQGRALAIAAAGVATFIGASSQAAIDWSATAAGTDWNTDGNWSGGTKPTSSQDAQFNQSSYSNQPAITDAGASIKGLIFGAGNTGGTSITSAMTDQYATGLVVGADGITLQNGSGNVTIGSIGNNNQSLVVGADQVWTNNSPTAVLTTTAPLGFSTDPAAPTTLTLSGGHFNLYNLGYHNTSAQYGNLTVNSGTTVTLGALNGTNFRIGTVTINSGATVLCGNGSSLGNTANTGTVVINGGTLVNITDASTGTKTAMSTGTNVSIAGNFTYDGTISGASWKGGDFGGGTLHLTLNGSAGARTITVNGTGLPTGNFGTSSAGATTGLLNLKGIVENGTASGLIKEGSGTLVLSTSAKTYTGNTIIRAGTLALNFANNSTWGTAGFIDSSPNIIVGENSSQSSAVFAGRVGHSGGGDTTIVSGQTLAGFGSVYANNGGVDLNTKKILIASGGFLSPGNNVTGTATDKIGTLTIDNLSVASGAKLKFDIGSGTSDQVAVTGGLTLSSLQFTDFTFDAASATNGTYTLLHDTGTLTGGLGAVGTLSGSLNAWRTGTLSMGGVGNKDVILTVVPEPATLGLAAGVAAMGLLGRRRRPAVNA